MLLEQQAQPIPLGLKVDGRHNVIVGVRPEDVMLGTGNPGVFTMDGVVRAVEPLGSEMIVHVAIAAEVAHLPKLQEVVPTAALYEPSHFASFIVRVPSKLQIRAHERLRLSIHPDSMHFFDSETHAAIPKGERELAFDTAWRAANSHAP